MIKKHLYGRIIGTVLKKCAGYEDNMGTFLEDYYNKFNEEKRLTSRHGQIEFRTSIHYVAVPGNLQYMSVLKN